MSVLVLVVFVCALLNEDLPSSLLKEVHFSGTKVESAIFRLLFRGLGRFRSIRFLFFDRFLALGPTVPDVFSDEEPSIVALGRKLFFSETHLLMIGRRKNIFVLRFFRQLPWEYFVVNVGVGSDVSDVESRCIAHHVGCVQVVSLPFSSKVRFKFNWVRVWKRRLFLAQPFFDVKALLVYES